MAVLFSTALGSLVTSDGTGEAKVELSFSFGVRTARRVNSHGKTSYELKIGNENWRAAQKAEIHNLLKSNGWLIGNIHLFFKPQESTVVVDDFSQNRNERVFCNPKELLNFFEDLLATSTIKNIVKEKVHEKQKSHCN